MLCEHEIPSLKIHDLKFHSFRFDELHYGKYVSLYLRNTFFFEKHPPLGKQLIAGVAYLAGFNGNYTFSKIGAEYSEVRGFWENF